MGASLPVEDPLFSLQAVLSTDVLRTQVFQANALPNESEIWQNSLAFPAGIASVSAVLYLLHLILLSKPVEALRARIFIPKAALAEDVSSESTITADDAEPPLVRGHVESLGGPVIFAFRCARLLCCLALLALSVLTVVAPKVRKSHSESFTSSRPFNLSLCGVYVYATLLSLISVLAGQRSSTLACRHLAAVLVATWAVYVYRDVWPLATFTLSPLDASEGWMLWTKFAILSIAGVVIPLTAPRQYIPLDPKDPKEPSPEQTASLLSMILYFHVDPLVAKASRTPHLKLDELPPVADYDMAKHLIERSFRCSVSTHGSLANVSRSDGKPVGKEWLIMCSVIVIRVLTSLASPVGMNKLLAYLETGGEGAVVRPWVWISWLFLGPVVGSVTFQWYIFVGTDALSGICFGIVWSKARIAMGVVRMIKLFGWEPRMSDQIAQKRKEELALQKKYQILNLTVVVSNCQLRDSIGDFTRYLVHLYGYYEAGVVRWIIILHSSKLFSSIAGKVSLERVQDFLRNTELLDQFASAKEGDAAMARSEASSGVVGIREAAFPWANESDESLTPGSQRR
ncbi:hypothetical protein OBBRIDRAFT_807663, partial [Obba rivulosa]